MGSSPSLQPLHQAQIPIRCQSCVNNSGKVKWRCEECDILMCDRCGSKDHAHKGHHIIDITTFQVKISDVKEYQTKMDRISFLAAANDNSLWIGSGILERVDGFHPFKSYTALQNIKLEGDKVKVKSSFNEKVWDIAVTPTNDILLAAWEGRLQQIKAGSNKVKYSKYCAKQSMYKGVHVTKDGRVLVSVNNVVVVMDSDGTHITKYKKDENKKQIFWRRITSITSNSNGNIFVAGQFDRKVVVFKKTEIINIYRGHSTVNDEESKFSPSSVVTTPMDNVIVADSENHTLHILNNTGHLLTTYNIMDIGLPNPNHLAITMDGSFIVLCMTCYRSTSLYKMVITGC